MTESQELPILDQPKRGDKMALVSFSGTAITENGDLVKHNWFKDLELDSGAYADIMLTPEEARGLRAAHQRMKTGASVQSIMTCWGPNACPMAEKCQYVAIQRQLDEQKINRRVVPITKPCPIETDIFHNAVKRLSAEFNIGNTEEDYTDQRFVLELAEIEVLENRINSKLAGDPEFQGLTEEKLMSTTTTKTGDVIDHYVKDVADLFKTKEKLWNRKDKIRKELVATRREKRLVAAREGMEITDASTMMAELTSKFKQMTARAAAMAAEKDE